MARKLKVDFTGVETFILASEGFHKARIAEIDDSKPSSNGDDMLTFIFEIISGQDKGARVFESCVLNDKALWKLKQILIGIGMKAESKLALDLDKLIGKTCEIEVFHDEYDGKIKAKIASYRRILDDPDDDEEDDDEPIVKQPTKPGKKATPPAKKQPEPEDDEDDDDDDEEEAPPVKAKPGRPKKAAPPAKVKHPEPDDEDEDEDDEDEDEPPRKPVKKGIPAKKKPEPPVKGKKKPEPEPEDDDDDEDEWDEE